MELFGAASVYGRVKTLFFLFFASVLAIGGAPGFSEEGVAKGAGAGAPPVASVAVVEAALALVGLEGGAKETRNPKLETRNRGRVAVVLIFVGHDCPISNAMMPELNRIVERFGPLGTGFYFVYPESDLTEEEAVRHATEFGGRAPVVVDRERRLVKRAGVKVTPEAAVFVARGQVAYRGRINDLYAGLRQRRELAETHDLADALEAVLVGRQPAIVAMPAVGCFISQKP